jgi:Flp pilus assembly protein TadD
MAGVIENLEALLAKGSDSPMLRFGLGKACVDAGRNEEAAAHLQRAVEQQPDYSAAWKLLGKALALAGRNGEAIDVYRRGIDVAEGRGDIQAAKEMKIFLKRLLSAG